MKFKTFRILAIGAAVLAVVGGWSLTAKACGGRRDYAPSPTPPVAQPAEPYSTPQPTAPVQPAQPATPTRELKPGEQALRPMDVAILEVLARPMSGEKIKDAFPSQSYKVNIYKDAGFTTANRLKIDLDRDEQDDEKWTLEGSGAEIKVKRQVSPKDDNTYPEEWRLLNGAWAPKE